MESEAHKIGDMVELIEPGSLLHKDGFGEVLRIREQDKQMLVRQNGNIVMYRFDQVKKTEQ